MSNGKSNGGGTGLDENGGHWRLSTQGSDWDYVIKDKVKARIGASFLARFIPLSNADEQVDVLQSMEDGGFTFSRMDRNDVAAGMPK